MPPVLALEIDAVVAGRGRRAVERDDLAVVVDRRIGAGADGVGIGSLEEAGGLVGDGDAAERRDEVVEVERLAVVGAGAGRWIVPALSMTKVPVAVGLSVPAVIRTASVRPWMVAPASLVSSKDVMLVRLVVLRLMPRATVDSISPLLSMSIWPAPGRMASEEVERMVPVDGVVDLDVGVDRGDGLEVERLTAGRRHQCRHCSARWCRRR